MTAELEGPDVAVWHAAVPSVAATQRAALVPTFERLAAERAGVAIATCHRVELYLPDATETDLADRGLEQMRGEAAVRHLVSLVIGLESVVLAEDQILHQVRTRLAATRRSGPLGGDLDIVFDAALRAGRTARSWRPGRPRSLADVALDWIERTDRSVAGRRLLVIGAGEMGRLAAAAARSRGALVAVASPTDAHASSLAADIGADVWPADPGGRVRDAHAIVIALAGPWSIADATVDAATYARAVVDLSTPSATPARLADRLGERFRGIDGLSDTDESTDGAAGRRFRHRLQELRGRTVTDLLERLASRHRGAVVGELAARVENERADELAAFWRRMPDLPAGHREAIDGMTRHLAERLFRVPMTRLGTDPDGRRQRAVRDLFGL